MEVMGLGHMYCPRGLTARACCLFSLIEMICNIKIFGYGVKSLSFSFYSTLILRCASVPSSRTLCGDLEDCKHVP